jgi:hypothetical protein
MKTQLIADRWSTMTADLAGEPAPPLPAVPGRLIRADDSDDDDAMACLEAMAESLERARALVRQLLAAEGAGWPVEPPSATPGTDPPPNP